MRSCLEWRWAEAGQEGVRYLLLLTGAEIGMAGGSSRRGGARLSPAPDPPASTGPAPASLEATLVSWCCWKWPYTSNIMGWVLMYSMKDLVTVTVMF